jgi:hypothetical protein
VEVAAGGSPFEVRDPSRGDCVAAAGGEGAEAQSASVVAGRARRDLAGPGRGFVVAAIADQLRRSPSTVSREVRANGGARRYRAHRSEARAVRLARRPKPAKLAVNATLREIVEAKLKLRWSPQQISGWLKRTPTGRRCVCRTRASTSACSSSPAARCARSSPTICVAAARTGAPGGTHAEQRPRPTTRDRAHLRTTGRCRGPGRARSLGRRPDLRQVLQRDRHPRRPQDAIRDAGPAAASQHRRRGR